MKICSGQGQDFSLKAKDKAKTSGAKVKAKTLSSKAKAKIFMRCPRGSSRPRPGLEDNKTGNTYKGREGREREVGGSGGKGRDEREGRGRERERRKKRGNGGERGKGGKGRDVSPNVESWIRQCSLHVASLHRKMSPIFLSIP